MQQASSMKKGNITEHVIRKDIYGTWRICMFPMNVEWRVYIQASSVPIIQNHSNIKTWRIYASVNYTIIAYVPMWLHVIF